MPTMQSELNEVKSGPSTRREHKRLQKQEKRLQRINQKEVNDDERSQRRKQRAERRTNREPVRRIFPIWLRIIVVLVLSYVALLGGLMVGFGVLGDGNPTDVLEIDLWRHIISLVTSEG